MYPLLFLVVDFLSAPHMIMLSYPGSATDPSEACCEWHGARQTSLQGARVSFPLFGCPYLLSCGLLFVSEGG